MGKSTGVSSLSGVLECAISKGVLNPRFKRIEEESKGGQAKEKR